MGEKSMYTEEESNRLLWLNWNRMSLLTSMPRLSQVQKNELTMRIDLSNSFTFSNEHSSVETEILDEIKESFNPELNESVEKYMYTGSRKRKINKQSKTKR
jgi:hypothetical protein